jgi:hypothetical protein
MRAATRFGSYRVESEGVLRGHEKPDYMTRPDSLAAEQYLSKLFCGGVEKYASQNTDTERQPWDGLWERVGEYNDELPNLMNAIFCSDSKVHVTYLVLPWLSRREDYLECIHVIVTIY